MQNIDQTNEGLCRNFMIIKSQLQKNKRGLRAREKETVIAYR